MKTKANAEAIRGRMEGQPASKYRAAAIACAAGFGLAAAVYRSLRGPDQ
jgi:hypothetical protein